MRFQNIFLVRAYKQNKLLFSLFVSYFIISFYFNYKSVETTPFFVWGMYSAKQEVKNSYKILTVKYNDTNLLNLKHTWQEPCSIMVYTTLNYYNAIIQNGKIDPQQNNLEYLSNKHAFLKPYIYKIVCNSFEINNYLPWLKKYITSVVNKPVYNILIFENLVHYDLDGKIIADSSKLLFTIK